MHMIDQDYQKICHHATIPFKELHAHEDIVTTEELALGETAVGLAFHIRMVGLMQVRDEQVSSSGMISDLV
jgi:hypothetical protein